MKTPITSTELQSTIASPSVWQENERERRITVTSGMKCFAPLERYVPLTFLVRTFMESSRWYSPQVRLKWEAKNLFSERVTRFMKKDNNSSQKPSSVTLSERDIPSKSFVFQLVPSVRPTGGTGCGSSGNLLPTPRAMEVVESPEAKMNRLHDRTENAMPNLSSMAKFRPSLLPTPTAMDSVTGFIGENDEIIVTPSGVMRKKTPKTDFSVKLAVVAQMLPTPTAQDFKKRGPNSKQQGLPEKISLLPTPRAKDGSHGGQLVTGKKVTRPSGQTFGASIADLGRSQLLPTPRVGGQEGYETRAKRKGHDVAMSYLESAVDFMTKESQQTTGETSPQLNPLFVAEMMSFPKEWLLMPFLTPSGEPRQPRH